MGWRGLGVLFMSLVVSYLVLCVWVVDTYRFYLILFVGFAVGATWGVVAGS